MGASFTLELHTTPPVAEIFAPTKTTYPTETYAEVRISADEALALDCQTIYIIDAKGFRHNYAFMADGAGGLIRDIDFSLIRSGIATIHAIVADEVWNSTELEVMVDVTKVLQVNFIEPGAKINANVLSQANGNYKRGTANFIPDSSKLVNKLWVKGGKAISSPYTQNITVGTAPIALFYTPRAPEGGSIMVMINGVAKTVGIQNIDNVGENDFLLNAAEKLLIPDLCTGGSGTIVYSYEYPIKLLLEDIVSQTTYGVFEDVYNVDTDDRILAREMGLQYLAKYSSPVITGSIEPMSGTYKPGELIKIEIPDLNIDDYLQIKEVSLESLKGQGLVNRVLQLESPERDAVSILKDLNHRLSRLEKSVYNDSEGPVEKYKVFTDILTPPYLVDSLFIYTLHQYLICNTNQYCGIGVMI